MMKTMLGRSRRDWAASGDPAAVNAAAKAAMVASFDSIRTNQNLSRKPPPAFAPPAFTSSAEFPAPDSSTVACENCQRR
jgi:hypothetical protein